MARTDSTYRPGVSIHEAAVMLGVSPTTVRRWVASGRLRSERYDRPQGKVVRVFLGPEQATTEAVEREQVSTVQVPTDVPPRTAEDMPPALTAWSSVVLAPIMAELSVSRETIRQQAETIGELRAENRALVARTEAQSIGPTPEPSSGRYERLLVRFRPYIPWLLGLLAIVVAVGLLVVPR